MTHFEAATLARFDRLERVERVAVLDHVRDCADCRQVWLADDPSRVFALLGRVDVPAAALDQLSRRIGDRIDGRRARNGLLGAASLAASLLLGALVGGYLYEVPRPVALERPATAGAPLTAGAAVETAADDDLVLPAMPGPRAPVRGVELLESPGTGKLVNLTVGETRVVMIFDAELDI